MTITLYKNDLPAGLTFPNGVAIDSETMGLNPVRDRLCLIQLSSGDGNAHLVQFTDPSYNAPNLKKMLADKSIDKLFHFARFDLAAIKAYLGVDCTPVYCTKTASRLVRTFTDRHSLKELCRELLGVELSKQQQSSDWGAPDLERRPAGLCRERRPLSASPARKTRCDAGPGRPHRTCPRLFRFPSRSRPARSRGLARF